MKPLFLSSMIVLLVSGSAMAARPAPPPLKIALPFEGPVAVAVLDARPDVVNGRRKPTFTGFSRSLYGIPFPIGTVSKKPLADDLGLLVTSALKLGGSTVTPVTTSPSKGRQGTVQDLQATHAERLILVEIRDWWSDTLVHTDLHYDLALTVFDPEGQELGTTSTKGDDLLGKRQRPERRDVPTATNDIISTLLTAGSVTAAFSTNATPAAKATSGCTVEQILKMKDAGLSQTQIEAACGSGN